jgi:hypothetical protein
MNVGKLKGPEKNVVNDRKMKITGMQKWGSAVYMLIPY